MAGQATRPPRRRRGHRVGRPGAPWRRAEIGLVLLAGVLAFGTCGYVLIGLTPFDAFYQTAITISTVGYAEIGPDTEVDRAYRVVTLALVFVGAGSVVYTVSILLEILVDRALTNGLGRRRMQRRVDRMRDHVIVAGWGRVGQSIARYARRHGLPVVAVDLEPGSDDEDVPLVVGDATEEDTLTAAGIERAGSLIAALGHDGDNLALTLTARSMRADLLIVARVADQRSSRKFRRAGADRVVNPYEIGGARMAALAFRPHVAEFLDEVVHAEEFDVDIHELIVAPGSPAVGLTLADVLEGEHAAIVAVKDAAGRYAFNPPPSRLLGAGDVLISIGSLDQLARLAAAVGTPG